MTWAPSFIAPDGERGAGARGGLAEVDADDAAGQGALPLPSPLGDGDGVLDQRQEGLALQVGDGQQVLRGHAASLGNGSEFKAPDGLEAGTDHGPVGRNEGI